MRLFSSVGWHGSSKSYLPQNLYRRIMIAPWDELLGVRQSIRDESRNHAPSSPSGLAVFPPAGIIFQPLRNSTGVSESADPSFAATRSASAGKFINDIVAIVVPAARTKSLDGKLDIP